MTSRCFLSAGDATIGARVFNVDVQQFDGDELIGGVRFVLRTEPAFRPLYGLFALKWGG
jgi:hypothetical protein